MRDSRAGIMLTALRTRLHGEILRTIHERALTNEDVARITGKRFDRHKRWKLVEGPEAIGWSPATFIDVAEALGIPVSITVAGAAVTPRKAKTTAFRPAGSAIRSPSMAA